MSLMTAARPKSLVSKEGSPGATILGWLCLCDPADTLLRVGDGGAPKTFAEAGDVVVVATTAGAVVNVLWEETLPINELGML